MARRSLFSQILTAFLVVIVVSLAAWIWETSRSMRAFHLDQTSITLEARANIVELEMDGLLSGNDTAGTDALCKEIGRSSGTRVTVILPSGKVIGDSDEPPAQMDSHGDRPEVREALAGRAGRAVRYSRTLRQDWVYVAVPVRKDGAVAGVVRASTSLASVNGTLRGAYLRIALAGVAVALLAVLVSLFLARRIAGPVGRMVEGTRRLAAGDFDTRLAPPNSVELAELAAAMNSMARDLRARMDAADRQRAELDAVLSSMEEGVLAADRDERVISLNRAAAELFGVDARAARGRGVREVVSNPQVQECVARLLENGAAFCEDVTLGTPQERQLLVSATGLRDGRGGAAGALLVLQDVTELRRLERVRSDFIANVSHELRTPVTSIKGYAETLLGDGRDDLESRERFLEIIARQADRLAALVEDILSLARFERSEAAGGTDMERVSVASVIEAAVQACAPKAGERQVRLSVSCPEGLVMDANPALTEQALLNLLDNAVKFSEPGGEVRMEAQASPKGVCLCVADRGPGIAPDHQTRIFERFYRVDRGRSRAMGGTGLGLAIVKHIMTLHGGRVEVESEPGNGSRFSLWFPAQKGLSLSLGAQSPPIPAPEAGDRAPEPHGPQAGLTIP
jgi:two-component system phosphate regulon sensor histidine kinase PhoR